MDAIAILEMLDALGVSVSAEDDGLRLEPGSQVPSDLIAELREHKQELMMCLAGHRRKYAGDSLGDKELRDIEATVREHGVCLLHSYVLEDRIAFVKDGSYLKDVPAGFVPYLDSELRHLFGGQDAPSVANLKLVHAAKKLAGGVVTGHEGNAHDKQP